MVDSAACYLARLLTVVEGSFLLLMRGSLCFASLIFALLALCVAVLVAHLGVAEHSKLLFDFGLLLFHGLGMVLASFWAVRLYALARKDGSMELELASPLSRSQWLLGRAIGLALSLVCFWALLVGTWQLLLLATGFAWFASEQLASLYLQLLGWQVTAMLCLFFCSFAGALNALLFTLAMLVVGLSVEGVSKIIAVEGESLFAVIIANLERLWNLQHFNRSPLDLAIDTASILGISTVYALSAIGIMLVMSAAVINKRELIF